MFVTVSQSTRGMYLNDVSLEFFQMDFFPSISNSLETYIRYHFHVLTGMHTSFFSVFIVCYQVVYSPFETMSKKNKKQTSTSLDTSFLYCHVSLPFIFSHLAN